jgi:hypothetical protein
MISDIYYKDVQLFKTQYIVDKVSSTHPKDCAADQQIVDDLVASAGLKRQDFYVVSFHSRERQAEISAQLPRDS